MATAARRTAPAASRTAAPATSSGYHGAEGRRKMQEEEERSLARKEAASMNASMPFRFFCPIGETREVVVIDAEPMFFRYEHNLKDARSNRWSIFCACVNESANCPVCKVSERPSYFAMYLTVIDLTPYESEKHGTVEWSKKLLVVKSAQQKKITRLWERHQTLRGMILSMTRDGEKDASIGNDIEFVEFMEEEELATYETVYEYEKDGKKVTKDILGHEVFDYDDLFPMPTEQQLRAIVGGKPEAGSREEGNSVVGRRGARGDDWDEAPAARTRPARRGAAEEPGAEEPDDAPPPRRGAVPARGAAPARAAAPAGRRAAPVQDEDEAEDPPQRAPRRAAAPAAAAPARRMTRAAPEPDDEPAPSATSLVDRRRALRR